MKLATLQRALVCECRACSLDILHDVIVASDASVAKALMVSEVARIARLEMRIRDYQLMKWNNRAKEASAQAGATVAAGESVNVALDKVDKTMGKWAGEVEARVSSDIGRVYELARQAGWKKATGKTTASLQYITPNFTNQLEAKEEVARKARLPKSPSKKPKQVAEASVKFDVVDKQAIADLQGDQMYWIGRHYSQNVRETIRNAVKPAMAEGVSHAEAGKRIAAAVAENLAKVTIPKGFNGSQAKYFEGLAANTATNARVRGQVRSFSQVGITKYEIVNPMDDRTTQICAFMNGKEFFVKEANDQIAKTSAAKTPDDVRAAHPWMGINNARSIFAKGGARGMAQAGLALPPYHFRCRSTVDVSVESMSFDDLEREGLEPERPMKPSSELPTKPVAAPVSLPVVPSVRFGELGEKVFGRKLSDADIDELAGLDARLPPGHKLVVSTRESAKKQQASVSAGIIDEDKNIVGTFGRDFSRGADGKTNVHHAAFFVDDNLQGSGIGASIFNAQVDAYVKQEIGKVSLEAAQVGRYVWTKAGFEWTNPEQIKQVFAAFARRLKRDLGAKKAAKVMATLRTPEDIARFRIGDKRIGKNFLIDSKNDAGIPSHIEMSQIPAKIKRL